MPTNPTLRSQIDALWKLFWSGGINNPLNAIKQISYLIFLKRLEDSKDTATRRAARKGKAYATVYEKYIH